MRAIFLFSAGLFLGQALLGQLTWQTIPAPVNTLTHLALGPNGELATFINGNPIQPVVSVDQGATWQTQPGTGGPNNIAVLISAGT